MTAGSGQALADLALAFVLSAAVGLEREFRQKSAGLRTYTLVGLAAALFMLVSKFGFSDVVDNPHVALDPSRAAAQVVSGIGFIGGGVIFMRRDAVRGLTTAASVWLTAALGMACGAGLRELAVAAAVANFLVMLVFPYLLRYIPRQQRAVTQLEVSYLDGRGILRLVLVTCTRLRFAIDHVQIQRNGIHRQELESRQDAADRQGTVGPLDGPSVQGSPVVVLSLQVQGSRPVSHLVTALSLIDGVMEVGTESDAESD